MAAINPTVRTWLVTLAVTGTAVGVVALAGGFAARDTSPIRVEAGQLVTLTRWDVTLHGCEIEPAEEGDGGEVVIDLDVTNRWRATLEMLEPAVAVELPTGETYGSDGEWYITRNDAGGGFDPGFAAGASIELETTEPLWEPNLPITVSLFDEASDDGYQRSLERYPSERVAVVDLVCTVKEVEQ